MVFWIVGAPLIMSRGTQLTLSKWQFFFAVLGLIVLPATWFALVFLREMGLLWLLTAMALVWVADIGAYFVGKAFGRRRLAPQLSPGKTVEGAIRWDRALLFICDRMRSVLTSNGNDLWCLCSQLGLAADVFISDQPSGT
jgi:CDP-diglyceride synthetase